MMGMMGGWMLLWALVGLAVIVLVVLATIWLARRLSGDGRGKAPGAQELLRRRYASGQLDREEYLSIQRDLRGG